MIGKLFKDSNIAVAENTAPGLPDWMTDDTEGELAVDVYEDDKHLFIKSTIAGVEPDHLEISLNHDLLTIRGYRQQEQVDSGHDYFCQECYWGSFSRSIILPRDVTADNVSATLRNGVLTISLPKSERHRTIPITVSE